MDSPGFETSRVQNLNPRPFHRPSVTPDPELSPDYILRNRTAWDRWAAEQEAPGRHDWASEPSWGIWSIPESELEVLPDVRDRDGLDLGCGTAYVSAWLARQGARGVGLDNSPRPLAQAQKFQTEFGLAFPLIHGAAEELPFRDDRFDLAISEYGASIWSDPYRWIPEASRVLKPSGQLIFLVNGTLLMLSVPDEAETPAGDRFLRDYFGMHRFEWSDDESVEFHLGYGSWIRLLRANGFEVEDLLELQPSEKATTRYPFVTNEWARRWPSEEIWKARRR